MKNYIDYKISEDINSVVKENGIEGAEEMIYRAYAGAPTLRDRYLKIFYKKFNFLNKP